MSCSRIETEKGRPESRPSPAPLERMCAAGGLAAYICGAHQAVQSGPRIYKPIAGIEMVSRIVAVNSGKEKGGRGCLSRLMSCPIVQTSLFSPDCRHRPPARGERKRDTWL
jgi:hypothetical protein